MRISRDKWTFIKHPSKRKITGEEVQYWKTNLAKILKVGIEFEFNLPDKNGTCKGNNISCPCAQMATETGCWKQCGRQEECTSVPGMEVCEHKGNRPDESSNSVIACKKGECATCSHFKFKCLSTNCTNFISSCFSCGLFEASCNNCKHKYDPNQNPDMIRDTVTKSLKPNHSYGVVAESGVHSIVEDGSLVGGKGGKGGMEVITTGRRIDYWEFFKMTKKIIDESAQKGAYVNERCSIHMHVLAGYHAKLFDRQEEHGIPRRINDLEKPLPEVVMANLHQLCRRYQNAMTWMMMGLNEPERMTRWEKFRVSVLEVSPIMSSMAGVKDTVRNVSGGNKYGWINYNATEFNNEGDITRFHVELRALDGILTPSGIAAFACLYYALVIKAVEISRYGIVEVGDPEWMEHARKVKDAVLNNMKDYRDGDRFGCTKNVHKYQDTLIRESMELIRQLKHILIDIGPCYSTLESLAERPCAIRRCEGQTWDEIEQSLAVPTTPESEFERVLCEYIDLRIVDECTSLEEWVNTVSAAIDEEEGEIQDPLPELKEKVTGYVEALRTDGDLIWSDTLGTVVKI